MVGGDETLYLESNQRHAAPHDLTEQRENEKEKNTTSHFYVFNHDNTSFLS